MSTEENEEVLRQVIEEGFNRGNYDALDALYAPDLKEHQFGMSNELDGIKRHIQWLRTAYPDFHMTIEDVVADGDKVWMRLSARGTNTGPLYGPPTGKTMAVDVFEVCRLENGRIVEHWGVSDRYAQMLQLGLLPLSGKG